MSNVYYAISTDGTTVAEFLSRDYDPDALVAEHGAVAVFDRSDGGRFVTAIRPVANRYGRGTHAAVDNR